MDVPDEIKAELVREKLQRWRNTHYDAELDAKIAEALGDERMKAAAVQRMKQALKAIDVLEGMLGDG